MDQNGNTYGLCRGLSLTEGSKGHALRARLALPPAAGRAWGQAGFGWPVILWSQINLTVLTDVFRLSAVKWISTANFTWGRDGVMKKRRAERNDQFHHNSCPCSKGPVPVQYPSVSSASSYKILPAETCRLCTFVKIKPGDSCTNRSSFACTASFPWELKHCTLAKDIYCQKLHFHCLGSKTSVTQVKQIMRPRVSHWSQGSEARIWFKGGMTNEKTLHGDGNLITARRSCYHHASQG